MAYDGTLQFDTKIDQSGFDKGIGAIESRAASAGNIVKGILGSELIKAGTERLIEAGKYSIELASDLEEVQNVVDVTFGEGAAQIEEFADTASSAFGLTELQSKQFTGTIGAMVKSMGLTEAEALDMSTSLVGLTGDMASFYNLDHETAFEKIRSGISGETEPLKQLGINMSVANLEAYALTKGLTKAYDKMSEAERVQLRYSYIMEQTADAQGDFARTQDSFANQVRVLQNNLDTLAANVGSALIPALTGAVGWVNSLFEPREGNPIQADVDAAVASLATLKTDITDLKNDYTRDAIRVQIDYEEAGDLVEALDALKQSADKGFGDRTLRFGMSGEDVAALQNQLTSLGYAIDLTNEVGTFGASTEAALKQYQTDMGLVADGVAGTKTFAAMAEADTTEMVKVTQQLVDLYPELEQYVGKDGVLMLEKGQVDELIASYRDLQLQKLMAARVEETKGLYADALIDLAILEQKAKEAEGQLQTLTEQQNRRLAAYEAVYNAFNDTVPGVGLAEADAGIAAMQQYKEAYGDLLSIMDEYAKQGGDISLLIDEQGMLRSAEEIESNAAAMQALLEVLNLTISMDYTEQEALDKEITDTTAALEAAKAAVDKYTPTVEALEQEVATVEAAIAEMIESGLQTGTETGTEAGQAAADALTDEEAAVDKAVEQLAKSAQAEARKHTIRIPVAVQGGGLVRQIAYGHATGLDYVPYDNYLARLHVGEAVLRAPEAQAYRSGELGGGIGAEELTAAMAPVVDAIREIRFTLNLDKRAIAEATAAENRAAMADYGRRVARGMGK